MDSLNRLEQRRQELVARIGALGAMRRGSLSEQYVEARVKDGSTRRRGPYTVYTYKQAGRTVSRRLTRSGQIAQYREQIAAFRSFQELTGELTAVSQQLADREVAGQEGCKKNSSR
jgi:hypothetical protein